MTSSMLATAIARPTRTWARLRDLVSRYLVRRETTSSRNCVNAVSMSRRVICSGRPPFTASMLAPNVVCRSREAPELVQNDVGDRILAQLDDDAHAVAVRLVPDVGDAFDALLAHGLGDLLLQRRACSPGTGSP